MMTTLFTNPGVIFFEVAPLCYAIMSDMSLFPNLEMLFANAMEEHIRIGLRSAKIQGVVRTLFPDGEEDCDDF